MTGQGADAEINGFRADLRSWAMELTEGTELPPVFLRPLCERFGIKIVKSPSTPEYKCYLSVDRWQQAKPLITLPAKKIGAFERFCIAHELGHYLLYVEHGAVPEGKRDYWSHEALCDDFARCLLMPATYLSDRLPSDRDPLISHLRACAQLSRELRVPWSQVARRVVEFVADLTFIRFHRVGTGDFVVMSTTLPNSQGRGKFISKSDALWEVLNQTGVGSADPKGEHRCLHEALVSGLSFKRHRALDAAIASDRFGDVVAVIRSERSDGSVGSTANHG